MFGSEIRTKETHIYLSVVFLVGRVCRRYIIHFLFCCSSYTIPLYIYLLSFCERVFVLRTNKNNKVEWCDVYGRHTYIAHMKHMAAPMNTTHTHTCTENEPDYESRQHLLKLMIAIASRHVMVSMSPTFLCQFIGFCASSAAYTSDSPWTVFFFSFPAYKRWHFIVMRN